MRRLALLQLFLGFPSIALTHGALALGFAHLLPLGLFGFIMIAPLLLYVPILTLAHRAQKAKEFGHQDPLELAVGTLVTSGLLLGVLVLPMVEAAGQALGVTRVGVGRGWSAILTIGSAAGWGALIVVGPLQFIRPRRDPAARACRLVAAVLLGLMATKFAAIAQFNAPAAAVTLVATALAGLVIRSADALWSALADDDALPDGTRQLSERERGPPSYDRVPKRTIGVAISGGGYRASLFGLGALMYIRDACRADATRSVVAISSVSGGSVTNGALARAGGLDTLDDERFASLAQELFRSITGPSSMFTGGAARAYYFLILPGSILLAVAAVWFGVPNLRPPDLFRVGGVIALIAAWFWVATRLHRWLPESALPAPLTLGLGAVALVATLMDPPWRIALALLGGAFVLAVWLAFVWHLRGKLLETTLGGLLHGNAAESALSAASSAVHHVFCASEVQFSETAYLAPDAIRVPSLGDFAPGDLTLTRAVRASAAFPGAFPPVFVPGVPWTRMVPRDARDQRATGSLYKRLILVDGGVRENLGISWFSEYAPQVDELVVISGAPNRPARHAVDTIPGLRELAALLRGALMPYEGRERLRRRVLAADLATRPGVAGASRGGAVVHIEDSPLDLPILLNARDAVKAQLDDTPRWDRLKSLPDWVVDQIVIADRLVSSAGESLRALVDRGTAAMRHVEAAGAQFRTPEISPERHVALGAQLAVVTRLFDYPILPSVGASWAQRASISAAVPTTFAALSISDAQNLVLHGYYLACANLHTILGWPLVAGLTRRRLDALAADALKHEP